MSSLIIFPNHWHNLCLIILLLTGIGCGEDGKYPMKVESIDKEEGKWGSLCCEFLDILSL
jgi:hypothetical protein